MTQPDQNKLRDDYPANGSTVAFPYTFKISKQEFVIVSLVSVDIDGVITNIPQILDTDYEVDGVGNDTGGNVTFFEAPQEPFTITLIREVAFDQTSVFVRNTPFPSKVLETNYDKLTTQTQENRSNIDVCLKPPDLPNFLDGTLQDGGNGFLPLNILQINETMDGFTSNPLQAVFGLGPLTAHQITQLGQIGETTFINASEWAFLGNMNQGVATGNDVTFNSVNGAMNLAELAGLTSDEIDQLKNIDSTIITTDNWSHLASLDQDLGMGDSPEFASLTINGLTVGSTIIHANQSFNTGAIENGNLSIASATTFNVSAGSGMHVDYSSDVLNPVVTDVSWNAFNNITLLNIGVGNFKSIGIDSAGELVQSDTKFTELQVRDIIPIGLIVHTPTDITFVLDETMKSIGRNDILTDFLNTIGTLNKNGNVFSANGANLSVDKTSGETFGESLNVNNSEKFANITTDASVVLSDFTPIFRDGSGGFLFGALTNVIDVGNYDDGSGTLQSVGVNQATNHRLAFDAVTGFSFLLYGQTLYSNLTAARDAIPDPFEVINPVTSPITVRAIVTARGGATDLTDVADATITEVSIFGASSGSTSAIQASSLQTSYDQGKTIDLDPADPVVLEVDTDTDTALSVNNSSSTETIGFTGEGNINQKGSLHLQGITNDTAQLTVTANSSQSASPIGTFEDSANNSSLNIYENKVEVTGNDDDEVPLTVTGSTSPNEKLFVVRDNAQNEKLSIDKDGQFLIDGAELESGAGEVVVAYAEFDKLNPINAVVFNVVAFDDPLIVGYRIELRDIRASSLGNDPGTLSFGIGIRWSDSNSGGFKNTAGNYIFNGTIYRNTEFDQNDGDGFRAFAVSPIFGVGSNDFVRGQIISADVKIANIPEFAPETMGVQATGTITSIITSSRLITRFENHGYLRNDTQFEEDQAIVRLQVNCSTLDFDTVVPFGDVGFTQGNIKVIGIKRGGPPFV